jgi:iron complex outermembrane recepter protein
MRIAKNIPSAISVLSLAVAAAAAPNVYGQSSGSFFELEEVIVTATKRETNLHDTAIAVSAFSSDMLETLNIRNGLDYEALVPSLTFQGTIPLQVSIRGIGRFSQSLGVNPGVAIYNDGIYQAEVTSTGSNPMNTQRTEILRGPQGTLYGRNTTGGAVNIITKRPTEEFSADLRARVGNYGLVDLGGIISGPITDSLRAKLYIQDTERDGLVDNDAGPDLNTLNSTFYEASIEWDITEKAQLWLKLSQLQVDDRPGPGAGLRTDPYDCVNQWSGLNYTADYLECQEGKENGSLGDPFKVRYNHPRSGELENNDNITGKFTYDFDSVQFSYTYGYLNYEYTTIEDYDRTDNDYSVVLTSGQYQKQITHEMQLVSTWDKKWNYVFGLFSFEDENFQPFNIHTDEEYYQTVANAPVGGQTWDNPLGVIYYQSGEVDNESIAAYGEVGIELSDQWSLTLGGRYSEDDYTGFETQLRYYNLVREFGVQLPYVYDVSVAQFSGDPDRYVDTVDAKHEDTYENFTGKISLEYRPGDGNLFWGTIANGYKMGGVRLGSLDAALLEGGGVVSNGRFDQEDLIMYELGWKGTMLDNKLQTEVVGFYYVYDDMQQLRGYRTEPPASISLSEVVNMDAETYGLEFSGTWLITDRLRAIGTYSYNNSEVTGDTFFQNHTYGERDENGEIIPENVKGNDLRITPEQKAALSVHYFWPTDFGQFTIGTTYAYVGKRYFDVENYDSEGGYTRLDLFASWTSENDRYSITATGRNVTDELVYNNYSCSAAGDGVYGTPSFITRCGGAPIDPELYAVEFAVKF